MSIDVGVHALRGSFVSLRKTAEHGDDVGHHLLRFYAAECGLKAALLTRMKARSTEQLPESLRSHDLRALAAALRLPAASTRGISSCALQNATSQPAQPHQVHEAWRYGARLSASAEKQFVAGLDSLIAWCRKELRL